ncbi:MAG TPA: serine--tRNA ligase [Candidatus Paceibacterota bacterium]|nr:serine--tRNA ligase [Candidatus Paceibacterota bacterium]HMP19119.1 serine--tRNA ligase [Candidatus Paceibacterota bacterium]HMP85123.1 serine--tRNA ligase [Candidatus Paceibacterota bacterium]
MLDIKFIRENKHLISAGAKKKNIDFNVDTLISVDDQRRDLLKRVEEMRAKQNETSKLLVSVPDLDKVKVLDQMKVLKNSLVELEKKLEEINIEWRKLMIRVPNIPDISVPDGADDSFNLEIKKVGVVKNFDFEPKDHISLMQDLDLADFERGTKISGFRGYVLKNDGAMLQWAISQFVLNKMVKKGYKPMIVPSLVKKAPLIGTGYLPQGEDDLYKTQDEDYLSGTAEVSTMYYYSDEILDKTVLPLKFISYSPCYRREAGSHSKDTKGLIRVHEFHKLEQVILCEASHEESVKLHEELLQNSEEILQDLGLPYRVVINAGGDLGLGQVKKYDVETWVPSQKQYRETHSASYFHDFQTRRLNIKYTDGQNKNFAHSLNNTAVAFPRILVPIIENYQQKDGTIKIPDVLVPYFGKDLISKQ